jgi:hypothetical protein
VLIQTGSDTPFGVRCFGTRARQRTPHHDAVWTVSIRPSA